MLGSRGVDPALRDDIVQEVAVRALDKQVPFADPDDLYKWAATAARNLHVDHLRAGGRTTCDDVLSGVADQTDVAYAVERRMALAHVWRALAAMRPGEREAILESLDEEQRAHTSQALVRRHRARASLRKAVGGVLVWLGGARLRLRGAVESPAFQTAGAAAMLAPALVLELAVTAPAPAAPRPPARVAAAAPRPEPAVRAPARAVGGVSAAVVRAGAAAPRARAAAPVVAAVRGPRRRPGPEIDEKVTVAAPGGEVGYGTGDSGEEDPGTLCLDYETQQDVCLPEVPPVDQ
jgi:DNA-directed RNA polymerase specialized sigma24 family protein